MESKGVFTSWSVSDFKATFNAIWQECKRLGRFIIEVRPWDEAKEISLQQMKWIHCDAGPIKLFADFQGVSLLDAELELKRKCARKLFVIEVSGHNWEKLINGRFFYECQRSICNKLVYPHRVMIVGRKRVCPHCGHASVRLIHINSKTSLSAKQTTEWMKSMVSFCEDLKIKIQMPDKDWKENKHE
ncbi:MAG: hypothetical protein PHF37_10145 [Phycisphaerae bacterium]|nr:hypothetical protein [Phycisphaerae bacterium]